MNHQKSPEWTAALRASVSKVGKLWDISALWLICVLNVVRSPPLPSPLLTFLVTQNQVMSPPSLPDTTSIAQPSSPPHFDVDKFNRDGYLIIPNFLLPKTVTILRQRVTQLLNDFSLEGHPMTKFSTGEKDAHVGDEVSLLTLVLLMNSISLLPGTRYGTFWRKRRWIPRAS